ncbi:MAG: hypothetical protein COC01_02475 [Bacteroidetes bacterium]|nr:response regulator [Bacteroidia bacterium]PCH68972.1 MAG: hypothetical protein COC01_02475 [Bacteroidota bacterium]
MNKIRNIIVLEDEEIVSLSINSCLRHAGYNVLMSYSNVLDLLVYLKTNKIKPDLITVDIFLSTKTNGYQAVEIINDEFPEIKIIYISAYTDNETMKKIENTTHAAFLKKPFKESTLLKTIENINDLVLN